MNTRKVAGEYRLAQWAQKIQARMQSGQSIKEFCDCAGISRNAYFYWQRKIREAACMELSEPVKQLVPSGWVGLEAAKSGTAGTGLTIEIKGCRVTMNAETDTELVAKACRILKSL